MSPAFAEAPDDLGEFPALEFAGELWRIHSAENLPEFFSSSGSGRFDLMGFDGRGTCYLASTPAGAFVEVFGDMRMVPAEYLTRKCISRAIASDKLRLANVTDRHVISRYGFGQEMSANLDYGPTQRWASAFYSAGFDGIWYSARHDPSGMSRSVAVFGHSPIDASRFAWHTFDAIDAAIIEEVANAFGIEVLPTALQ